MLSAPQLRVLGQRMQSLQRPEEDRDLTAEDLISIGYGEVMAKRILALLEEEELELEELPVFFSALALTSTPVDSPPRKKMGDLVDAVFS